MIAFIDGIIDSYNADSIVLNHDGMGWQIFYPHIDQIHLNEEVKVYTYLHYTEQELSLFGFSSREEKELFLRLIKVKGLGPRTAMNMLAKKDYASIIKAIETGNVAELKKLPGIGAKTASQIVLDLKGKLVPAETKKSPDSGAAMPLPIQEACEGLATFGFRPNEISAAADYMSKEPGKTTEEYLRIGLQFLRKNR